MSARTTARRARQTPLSPRTLEALAHFGLSSTSAALAPPDFARTARCLLATLQRTPHAHIALITGPSGAGKSSLLRSLERTAATRGVRVFRSSDMLSSSVRRKNILDCFRSTTDTHPALAMLARFGLGDATLLTRTPLELSDGQRARLALALAFDAASRPARGHTLITCDEFSSGLDRATAHSLCATLNRIVGLSRSRVSIALATAHQDVQRWLGPLTVCDIGLDHRGALSSITTPARDISLSIEPGAFADYAALAHLHYRAGRPACLASGARAILVARSPHSASPVGVLVMAMPTLNARWRSLAWPGRFSTANKSRDARLLNDQLRCIARVIVDPRFRGAGVARRLVRGYLQAPLTPCTEAVAAMGAACPFFERAGMTPIRMTPAARHVRLLDTLDAMSIHPSELLDRQKRDALLRRHSLLRNELARWASASRAGRRWRDDGAGALEAASRAIASEHVAYVHERL